jgi:RimJ/RimL family protein N-acetyltransferase
MNPFVHPVHLENDHVELRPLTMDDADDLREATRDGDLHTLWFTAIPNADGMATEIERRLALQRQGLMNPFAVINKQPGPLIGRAVGMTTYMNIDVSNRRVEIGSTWYRRAVQRTRLNSACKRLLLAHAFEHLACIAVEFRTHAFNHRSRRAIERLGAKLDGILRNHQINPHPSAPNTVRDTCVYSIIDNEWPTVRAHLDFALRASTRHSL